VWLRWSVKISWIVAGFSFFFACALWIVRFGCLPSITYEPISSKTHSLVKTNASTVIISNSMACSADTACVVSLGMELDRVSPALFRFARRRRLVSSSLASVSGQIAHGNDDGPDLECDFVVWHAFFMDQREVLGRRETDVLQRKSVAAFRQFFGCQQLLQVIRQVLRENERCKACLSKCAAVLRTA
jgi:hypothetical protein